MGRKLYVGNLPYETGETELQELFARPEPSKPSRSCATWRPAVRAASRSWK